MPVALRNLTRSPWFFLLALPTLALGTGAATVLFSVTESLLWGPLPFADSERLVLVAEQNLKGGFTIPRVWRDRPASCCS